MKRWGDGNRVEAPNVVVRVYRLPKVTDVILAYQLSAPSFEAISSESEKSIVA
jgi:hypothetical protein